jgi:DNA polymerase-4
LLQVESDGTPFRLIGVGVTGLCDPEPEEPGDLLDAGAAKRARAEAAMDDIRARYGDAGLTLGLTFTAPRKKPKRSA